MMMMMVDVLNIVKGITRTKALVLLIAKNSRISITNCQVIEVIVLLIGTHTLVNIE